MWTPDEDATLRELWATGLSTIEIGQRMGRTKNAVVGRAHRMDLPGRASPIAGAKGGRTSAWTPELQARAMELRGQGFSWREIGTRIGVGEETVRHHVRRVCPLPAGAPRQVNRIYQKPPMAMPKPAAPAPVPLRFSAARGCRWPMWKNSERATHVYCDAPVSLRADGVPGPYCRDCAARAYGGAPPVRPPSSARRLGYA